MGEILGVVDGFDMATDSGYIDGLVIEAHRMASDQFDITAAATANAGYLTHVFEYGVPGITHGPMRHADPTAPTARLWTHQIGGRSGVFNINYLFRPAVTRNPNQTVARTGVKDKYIKRLSRRKYVFRQRARVTEMGEEVTIKSKHNRLLFVPFYGKPPRNSKSKRGYAMVPGPITAVPGRNSAGTFTAFWSQWWGSEGSRIMQEHIETQARKDIERYFMEAEAAASEQRLKSPSSVQVSRRASQASRKTKGKAIQQTTKRKSKEKKQ